LINARSDHRETKEDCLPMLSPRTKAEIGRMSVRLLIIVALLVAAISAWSGELGQGQWCWLASNGESMFCGYVSFSSCRESNKGLEGVCIPWTL
jgi:hypothetical protein